MMFRQWRLQHGAAHADWLLGGDIIGPLTRERGYTCLRDMAEPDGKHRLAPQPAHYAQLKSGPHPNGASGPPNLAFCTACKQIGGNSWERIAWTMGQPRTDARTHRSLTQPRRAAPDKSPRARGLWAKNLNDSEMATPMQTIAMPRSVKIDVAPDCPTTRADLSHTVRPTARNAQKKQHQWVLRCQACHAKLNPA